MGKKIMITGSSGMLDNGEVAILNGVIVNLKQRFPELQFYIGSTNGNIDSEQVKRIFPDIHNDIKLANVFSSPKIHWILRACLVYLRYIVVYPGCNIGIHIGADGYNDNVLPTALASCLSSIGHSYQLLLGKLFGKPVVACSMTIGPFNTRLTRLLSRFALNRVNLITAREKTTRDYLKQLGIASPVHLVADAAFLMEAADKGTTETLLKKEGILSTEKLVGIAPSRIAHYRITAPGTNEEKEEMYVKSMANLVDYLADKDLAVILLCQATNDKYNDVETAQRIRDKAKYKPKIIDNRKYTPQEMKGMMRCCQIMVSSKLHSTIASTSAGTPTVTIASSPKIYSIIGDMLSQQDLLVDITTPEFSEFIRNLLAKTKKCWIQREMIRCSLQEILPAIQKMALQNIDLIANLIENRKAIK